MKILVVGQGGREHALVRALKASSQENEIFAWPGNPGMQNEAHCHIGESISSPALFDLVENQKIDLVVIGPEAPLVDGLADELRKRNVSVFGPGSSGARLEGSKVFSKEFLVEAQIPTAKFHVVKSRQETMDAASEYQAPYVFKVDGLAAGKGVYICEDLKQLESASIEVFEDKKFSDAGNRALLEKFEPGWELSLHLLIDGSNYEVLPLSQDHKRLKDGDQGPNTGGMGCVAPLKIDSQLNQQIKNQILDPLMVQIATQQIDYRGVLYVGIMMTAEGPKVLEFNVRFGDPETQVLLPLLEGDWAQVMLDVSKGKMTKNLTWKDQSVACIVLAASGYPEEPIKGDEIQGDLSRGDSQTYILHAGTKQDSKGDYLVNGGRVLNILALRSSLKEAINSGYSLAESIHWPGIQYRKDIGAKQL